MSAGTNGEGVRTVDGMASRREWRLPPCRSYLYITATRPERFEKALASEADAVIVDLDDGVAEERKEQGRKQLVELLATPRAKPVFIRVNAPRSGHAEADIEVAARLPVTGIRIPKVHAPSELPALCDRIRELEFSGGLQVLIESGEGVMNLREIAEADPMVEMMSLGEGDLCADLGCEKDALDSVRTQLVAVSRALGLQRPIQAGHPELTGTDLLESTTRQGQRWGFFGRIAVHPAQLPTINRVYTRCRHEVEYARDALARLADIHGEGQTTTRDMHGKYLSEWYRARGERVMAEFEIFGAVDSCPVCEGRADGGGPVA